MGTRVNYFLASDIDSEESQIAAVLFSNNSDSDYDPEKRLVELANESHGITDLATKLLNEQYPSKKGRPFCLDSVAEDNERVILVYWDFVSLKDDIMPIIKELPAGTVARMDAVKAYLQ